MTDEPTTAPPDDGGARVFRLRSDAWSAWNASYHATFPDVYRSLGRSLYEEALHEQIESLFAELDQQNARLDAALPALAGQSADEAPV